MIKNILYSLLLHSLIAGFFYSNLKQIIIDKNLESQIKVSVKLDSGLSQKKSVNKQIAQQKETKKKLSKIKKSSAKINSKAIENIVQKSIKEIKNHPEKQNIEKQNEENNLNQNQIKQNTEESFADSEKNVEENSDQENIQEVVNLEHSDLSEREKFNIYSQLHACYSRASKSLEEGIATKENKISIIVKVKILSDGTIDFNEDEIIDQKRYADKAESDYRDNIDRVINALELCSPLRNLPIDKYNIWNEFEIKFE